MNNNYDVFISHASEDKDDIVRNLATHLTNLGYRVWYDEFSLSVGDGLRRSIDLGLSHSRYGIIILSKNFFLKGWTNYELDGLLQIDFDRPGMILPIWHNLGRSEIAAYSTSLANKVAIATKGKNFEQITDELVKKIGEYRYIVAKDLSIIRDVKKSSISVKQRDAGFQLIKSIQTDTLNNKVKSTSRHDVTIIPYAMNFSEYDFNFWQKEPGDFKILRHAVYDIDGQKLISSGNEIFKNNGGHVVSKVKFARISNGPIRIVCDFTTTNLFHSLFENDSDDMEFNHNSEIEYFSYTFSVPDDSNFKKIRGFVGGKELKAFPDGPYLSFAHILRNVSPGTTSKYVFSNKYR